MGLIKGVKKAKYKVENTWFMKQGVKQGIGILSEFFEPLMV
jgi:hypothetical protein